MEFLLSAQYFLTGVAKVWCLAIFCSRSHSAWWSWTSASSAASTSSFSLPSHVVGKNTLENINFQLITRTTISLQSIVELHLSIQFRYHQDYHYHSITNIPVWSWFLMVNMWCTIGTGLVWSPPKTRLNLWKFSGMNQLLWYYADLEKKQCLEVSLWFTVFEAEKDITIHKITIHNIPWVFRLCCLHNLPTAESRLQFTICARQQPAGAICAIWLRLLRILQASAASLRPLSLSSWPC